MRTDASRLIAAGLLLLVGTGASGGPMVLHRGTAGEPPSIDPSIAAASPAAAIIADLYTGLLVRDAASQPVPGAAVSWTISADGLVYTFRLRENQRWSDGKPLDAEDFVYSFRRLMVPATASTLSGVFFFIEGARKVFLEGAPPETLGVSAPDPRTFVIRLEHPVPYLLQMLANLQVAPVPRHAIEAHGREWTKPGRMVGNGAYILAERVPQTLSRLVRNPNFFAAETVKIDEVYWHPTQDLATSLRRFRAGEFHIVLNFPPDQIDWLRANMSESLHIVPNLATYFLTVNTAIKPFDDVRVRKALSIAIDREAITDKLLRTGVRPAWSYTPPDFDGYGGIPLPDRDKSPPQRQAEARALLQQAGFGPANPLTVPLLYDSQEENRQIMVAITSMWQAIGVKADLTNVAFGVVTSRIRTREYVVARNAYFASFGDAYSFLSLLESGNPNNWPQWSNRKFDALLKQSNSVQDATARMAILREADTLLTNEYPLIPIFYYVGRRLVSPEVKGWVDTVRGMTATRFLWLEQR